MFKLSKIIIPLGVLGVLFYFVEPLNHNLDNNYLLSNLNSTNKLVAFSPLNDKEVSGTFAPKGRPAKPPIRVTTGKDCIVDIIQTYLVTGTLSGTFKIDFRILVLGPCGSPPGTYNEEWIAHGTFNGKMEETPVSGTFSYKAQVAVGGEVNGQIVFGQGMGGKLEVKGNFKDGKLSYKGLME